MAAPATRRQYDLFERRWRQLDNEFQTWLVHGQELSTFLLPRNGRFFTTDRNKGQRRHNSIYDNTGTRGVRTLGAGLMAGATSPARPWFRVVTGNPELDESLEVSEWCEDVTKQILRVCAKSNVYRVLHQMYEELAVFGTAACIMFEDAETGVRLQSLTYGEYRLAMNYKGQVDTCYRTFQRTVSEVVQEFGINAVSKTTRDAYNEGFLENPVTIRHVIEPRRDRDATLGDNRNMRWKSVFYETGREEDEFLYESGFDFFPVLAPRWATAGGDTYGYSPGMEALGDVKQLQHQQLRKAQAIDFQTLPPQIAPPEMKGSEFKWVPGGVTFAGTPGGTNGLRTAFEVNLNLQHLELDIEATQGRINSAFFADIFRMLSFQNTSAQKMTATEVAERHEEKLIQLGPVLERLHTELLEPLVHGIYRFLEASNQLPPPPPEIEGEDLTLEFISMLAQAQRAVSVAGIERVLTIAGNLAEVKPDMLDNLDEDGLWSEITSMIGVSPRITRSPQDRDKRRKAKLDAQKAAAQAAIGEQTSKTLKNTSDAASQPNALQDVVSMFSGYDNPPAQAY